MVNKAKLQKKRNFPGSIFTSNFIANQKLLGGKNTQF